MELYPSGQFGFIDDPDRQFGNGSVWTRTRARSDGPQPLLTLDKTTRLDVTTTAKISVQCWAREKEAKIGAGVRPCWTGGSHSHDGRVGAAPEFKHGHHSRSCRNSLGTGPMELFHTTLWAIRLVHDVMNEKRVTSQRHGVKMLAGFSESQTTIGHAAQL